MTNILPYMRDILSAMREETTLVVQIWMIWMGLIFMASIFFVKKHVPARVTIVAMFMTLASVLYIWHLTKNIHLFGVAHILIWFPLAAFIWGGTLKKSEREKLGEQGSFLIWVILLFITILVSLVFDIRDIFLVMQDAK